VCSTPHFVICGVRRPAFFSQCMDKAPLSKLVPARRTIRTVTACQSITVGMMAIATVLFMLSEDWGINGFQSSILYARRCITDILISKVDTPPSAPADRRPAQRSGGEYSMHSLKSGPTNRPRKQKTPLIYPRPCQTFPLPLSSSLHPPAIARAFSSIRLPVYRP